MGEKVAEATIRAACVIRECDGTNPSVTDIDAGAHLVIVSSCARYTGYCTKTNL